MSRRRIIRRYRTGPTRYPSARPYRARWAWLRLTAATLGCAALIAAVAVPAVLIIGAGAREGTKRIDAIDELVEPPLPQTSVLLTADGSVLATVYTQNRIAVDIAAVPQVLIDALLSVEDTRFFEHNGVDFRGTARAMWSNARGGDVQGGSTITQQYVKNVLALSADNPEEAAEATERTTRRKLLEAHYALELEARLSKDEILERYLNTAYFGAGAWGVEAAARTYFGHSVSEVDLAEAALLAGLVRSPNATNPYRHPDAATERRRVVLSRMVVTGRVDGASAAAAAETGLELSNGAPANGCASAPYPFFCDWVLSGLEDNPMFGADAAQRRETLARGGLTITTTIDPRAQNAAQNAVDALPHTDRVAAATAVVAPGTGDVVAFAVNRDWGNGPGATMVPLVSDADAPGASLFKVFTLTAAVEAGAGPEDHVRGGSSHTSKVFDNPASGSYTNSDGKGRNNPTIAEATAASQNTAFVQLLEHVGVDRAADTARRLGLRSLPQGSEGPGPKEGSFTLGARTTSPLEMATVFATLAAGGTHCDANGIVSVADAAGTVTEAPRHCEQAVDGATAATVTAMLEGVVTNGTGTAAAIGRPVAGKTGTADDFGAAWFAGYTADHAAAVWVGDPRGPAHPLLDVAGIARVYGGTLPAKMFAAEMTEISNGLVPKPLTGGTSGLTGSGPVIGDVVGTDSGWAAATLTASGADVEINTVDSDRPVRAGTVLAVRPGPGTPLFDGTEITLDVAR